MKAYAPSVMRWDPKVEEFFGAAMGSDRLRSLSAALVQPSLKPTVRLNTLRAAPQVLLQQLALHIPDSATSELRAPRPAPYLHALVPHAAVVPGRGPLEPDYTACREACLKGADVFAPGLLGLSRGVHEGDLLAVSVAPEPAVGARTTRGTLLDAGTLECLRSQGGGLYIGTARAMRGRVALFREQSGRALAMEQRVFDLPPLNGVMRGLMVPQALPCIVAAHVLAPAPGARVLDLCAAPGGKATMLAQLMGDSGLVVALDRTHAKAQQVRSLASDLGLSSVHALVADSTQLYQGPTTPLHKRSAGCARACAEAAEEAAESTAADDEARWRTSKATAVPASDPQSSPAPGHLLEPGSFDHVLLDAPCSALGLRPRLSLAWTLPQLRAMAAYQRALLHSAVHMLRPGGTLVYCTCSINPAENEGNVRYALDCWQGVLELVEQQPRLGGPGLVGPLGSPQGGLSPREAALVQRFTPGEGDEDTIGFFIAKFVKRSS